MRILNHSLTKRPLWQWILAISLVLFTVACVTVSILAAHAEPILRARVIETLSTRFQSKVELDSFHVSVLDGLQVSGKGLRIFGESDPNNHEPGIQPIIAVAEFRFRTGILTLLRVPMHVDTAYVKGLQLNLPPREHRGELRRMSPKNGK